MPLQFEEKQTFSGVGGKVEGSEEQLLREKKRNPTGSLILGQSGPETPRESLAASGSGIPASLEKLRGERGGGVVRKKENH